MGLPAPAVPLTAVLLAVVAIFTCYIMALNGHHMLSGLKELVRSCGSTHGSHLNTASPWLS